LAGNAQQSARATLALDPRFDPQALHPGGLPVSQAALKIQVQVPAATGSVRAGFAGSLKSFLSRYPLDSGDRLLLESGLDPESMDSPDGMISLQSSLTFLESASKQTGDECFGLQFAAQMPWSDLGILGYVMRHSPTLASALENACRYFAVQQTLGQMTFSRGRTDACITYSLDHPGLGPARQNTELLLLLMVRFCREAIGNPDWAPSSVRFVHNAPSDTSRHDRFFGTNVRFGRPENAIVIPSADLDAPLKTADAALLPILRRHAEDCLPKFAEPGNYADVVKRLVTESLSTGSVSIDEIAARMETSSRSLQRRLRDSGKTFQQVLGETRLALSQRYLEDRSLSLTETAFLLGYSDLSAFSRAFRRWTGKSPLSFRKNRN
jgi:AraC-like DNA-binding protein